LGDRAHGSRSTTVRARLSRLWQAAEKIVYSRTLAEPRSARTRIEREFDPGAVRRLKADAEHDITVDGPELAAQAMRAGLFDQFQMIVCPVVVGSGKRFFPEGVRLNLELVEERRFRKCDRSPVRRPQLIVVRGVERHPPTVAPAHATIDPGQERCELAVEADAALAASRDHAATPALTRDKGCSVDRLDPRWSATRT
jgi:hypothetical protein